MPEAPSDVVRIRGALDAALLDLRAVQDSEVPVREAEPPLARSVAQLYQALASTHDATAFRLAVSEAVRHAEDALLPLQRSRSSDPAVLRSVASLSDAVRTLSGPVRIPSGAGFDLPGPRKGAEVVTALVGEPRLLELRRPVLEPAVPVAAPEQPPAVTVDPDEPPPGAPVSLAQLLEEATAAAREEPLPAEAPPPRLEAPPVDPHALEVELFGAPLSEERLRFERARHFFEDLGTMGLLRHPDGGGPWRGRAPLERRLLARVDAILACGLDVFPQLVRLLAESPLPDAELTWAAILLHGMIAGDDMADEVVRLVHVSDASEPATFDAVAEALRLVPHPGVEAALQGWVRGAEPRLRRLALRALAPRGRLEVGHALAALDSDDPDLRAEGARALPQALGDLDDARLGALLRSREAGVVEAALQAALLRRRPVGPKTALGLVQEGRGAFARAAVYAALAATETAKPVFARARTGAKEPVLAEALGWLGDLDSVDVLLAWLEQGEPAAARALQRLTGASLSEALPDPTYASPEEQPFGRTFRPPPPFEVLSDDAAVWSAWWTKHRGRAQPGLRTRWGRAFSPAALLWEVDEGPFGPEDRTLAWMELVVRTGELLPLHVDDFVARQERELDGWRRVVGATAALQAGAWRSRVGS